ncbi:hypothetical protein FRC20_003178 [Serendipita sp. 405]|nr:hypothetical protein FRC15_003406 [Serendipita sp. 397]KAG8778194.1 hypothetical protein FRC16_003939 [Serendipita sp. 398]KAG8845492.1 hypothetical protein FRC20_003178 [Serendipita sp. 405]
MSKLFWQQTFSLLGGLVTIGSALNPQRDGIVTNIDGWDMIYRAIRWEPICGTYTEEASVQDETQNCVGAVEAYRGRNVTDNAIGYFDISGVRYDNAGIGLGVALCACFSLSNNAGEKPLDICWYFDEVGECEVLFQPYGSYRYGRAKSLEKCNAVNVTALASQWSQTAIMPTPTTGPVHTLQLSSPTVVQTPTVIPVTITSPSVITGSNGQVTTRDVSYVTTVSTLSSGSSNGGGANDGLQRVKIGVGLGVGLPALAAVLCYAIYIYNKRNPPTAPTTGGGGGGGGGGGAILPAPAINPVANHPVANPMATGYRPTRY